MKRCYVLPGGNIRQALEDHPESYEDAENNKECSYLTYPRSRLPGRILCFVVVALDLIDQLRAKDNEEHQDYQEISRYKVVNIGESVVIKTIPVGSAPETRIDHKKEPEEAILLAFVALVVEFFFACVRVIGPYAV